MKLAFFDDFKLGVVTGDTLHVTWDIANQTGLAICGAKGNDWDDVWTFTGVKEGSGEICPTAEAKP